MNNFVFYNPVKIIFGEGTIAKLTKELPSDAHVLVLYGGGSIKRNGVYDQVVEALNGHRWLEFAGIEPNPHYETCMKAVDMIRRERITYLLAVGGGSVADATKFIAAAAHFEGDAWDIIAKKSEIKSAVPLACILTLPATGSEMNNGAVITRASTKEKFSFQNDKVFPQFSVLDPTTTYSLPPHQTANGIVDAFVHVLEQYLTFPNDACVQDRFSEGILSTLLEQGPRVMTNGEDYDARANVMWAATMALNGLLKIGVAEDWATHMIGHELTALRGLDHAQSLAVVMPSLMQVQRADKQAKILQMGERVFGINSGTTEQRVDKTIDSVEQFFRSLGVKTKLSEYGVKEDVIGEIVERFKKRDWKLGEKANITPEVTETILKKAL